MEGRNFPTPDDAIREAETWIGTPFHHQAQLKGHGVDCGQLLLGVYEAIGVIPHHVETEFYPPDFHIHSNREWFREIVLQFCNEVDPPPRRGDVAVWRFGRVLSHGAIIVDWPHIIHAFAWAGHVQRSSAELEPLVRDTGKPREVHFFRPKLWCE